MLGINLRRSRQKALYCTITVTGSGNSVYSHLEIDGTQVTTAGTYRLKRGAEIACYASCSNSTLTTTITCNGTTVATGCPATYSHIATNDATIELSVTTVLVMQKGTVTITEK